MKTYQTVLLMALITATQPAQAQNVQLHYDLGSTLYHSQLADRPSVTTTIEHFAPDTWGNTYFFADLDYYGSGMAGAYWEISREFNLTSLSANGRHTLAAHAEYNGGLSTARHLQYSSRFQHALLAGLALNWHSTDFARTFSLQTLYKQYFHGEQPQQDAFASFQLTTVWGIHFAHRRCTFSGFCDVWYDPNVDGRLIVLSEPQFWFHLRHLPPFRNANGGYPSIGTEVEISNNFVYTDSGRRNRFFAIPTLAIKWTF